MTTTEEKLAPRPAPAAKPAGGLPLWVSALLPLVLLAALLAVFAFGNPLALFRANLPAVEDLAIQPVRVTDTGFEFRSGQHRPDAGDHRPTSLSMRPSGTSASRLPPPLGGWARRLST